MLNLDLVNIFFRIFLIYVDSYELETVYGDDKKYHWATIHNTFSEKDFSKYVRSMCKRIRRMEMYDKLENKELDFLIKNDFIKVSEQFGVKYINQRLHYKNWDIGYFWVRRKSGRPLQVYVSVYFGGFQNRTNHLHEYEEFLGKAVYEAKRREEDRRIDEMKKDFK